MNQMTAPEAPAESMEFGRLFAHYYRRGSQGRVFFAGRRPGTDLIIVFPVLEDGNVSCRAHLYDIPYSRDLVEVVSPSDLGMPDTKIRWSEEVPDPPEDEN
jgi:hypothetical protein